MNDTLKIDIVGNESAFSDAMSVRRSVFVQEHGIPEYLEFEGNDYSSSHLIATDNGQPVGTMRIRYFNGFVKFERMCVLPPYRKTDISERLMRRAMSFAAEKGYDKAYGVCKKELLARWQADGFVKIPGVEPIRQNGMTLVPIYCPLDLPDKVLTMQTPAEILNAREGHWDEAREQISNKCKSQDFNKKISELFCQVRLLKAVPEKDQQSVPYKPLIQKCLHDH